MHQIVKDGDGRKYLAIDVRAPSGISIGKIISSGSDLTAKRLPSFTMKTRNLTLTLVFQKFKGENRYLLFQPGS